MKKLSSYKVAVEIENELNDIRFFNVPLGRILGAYLYYYWWAEPAKGSFIKKVKRWYWTARYLFTNETYRNTDLAGRMKGKKVFAVTDLSERCVGFFKTLVPLYVPGELIFTGPATGVKDIYGIPYTTFPGRINKETKALWRKQYDPVKEQISIKLDAIQEKYDLPEDFRNEMMLNVIMQTQQLMLCYELMKEAQTPLVLADHDRQALNSNLTEAAKLLRIPSYSFIHGSTYPGGESYYPVIADHLLCWGNRHVQQFTALGTPPSKLLLAGNTKVSPGAPRDRKEVIHNTGLPGGNKNILLVTNNIALHKRHQLVRSFYEFISEIQGVQGIVKLHPAETRADYEGLQNIPGAHFFTAQELGFEDSLCIADLIVTHSSTYGLEALAENIPVIILDVLDEPKFIGDELILSGGCPAVHSKAEMEAEAGKLMNDNAYRDQVMTKGKNLVADYFYASGNEAAHHVKKILDSASSHSLTANGN